MWKRCQVAELSCLAFYLKQTEKYSTPNLQTNHPIPDNSFLHYCAGRKVECGQTPSVYPGFYKYLQSSMPNIFVLSPEEHSQHSKAPFSWMVSVHWQFKGIQVSKLGQFKTCLFKIISFWVSDYELGLCSQTLQQRVCSLSRKRKVYFI
jgi:hypothetical protein